MVTVGVVSKQNKAQIYKPCYQNILLYKDEIIEMFVLFMLDFEAMIRRHFWWCFSYVVLGFKLELSLARQMP